MDSASQRVTEEAAVAAPSIDDAGGIAAESLIEEVSIDGMCGVY